MAGYTTSTRVSACLAQSYMFMICRVSLGHSTMRGWPVQPLPDQKAPSGAVREPVVAVQLLPNCFCVMLAVP